MFQVGQQVTPIQSGPWFSDDKTASPGPQPGDICTIVAILPQEHCIELFFAEWALDDEGWDHHEFRPLTSLDVFHEMLTKCSAPADLEVA